MWLRPLNGNYRAAENSESSSTQHRGVDCSAVMWCRRPHGMPCILILPCIMTVLAASCARAREDAAAAIGSQHKRLEPLEPSRLLAALRRDLLQVGAPPPPGPQFVASPPPPPPPEGFFPRPPPASPVPPFPPPAGSPPPSPPPFPPLSPFTPSPPSPSPPPPPQPPRPPFPDSPPLPPRPPRPPPQPPTPPPSPTPPSGSVVPQPRPSPPLSPGPSPPPSSPEPDVPASTPPPPTPYPPIAAPPPPPPTPSAAGASAPSSSLTAAVGGSVAGAALLCLVLAGAAVWWRRRQRTRRLAAYGGGHKAGAEGGAGALGKWGQHEVTGLGSSPLITTPGVGSAQDSGTPTHASLDPGTHGLAFQFPWTSTAPLHPQHVEAGFNDARLDKLAGADGTCPVVQLTATQVAQELQLLTDGLLGKGGTAVVFKGLWPSRFGPDAVLAVKVLSNAYAGNETLQRSFQREAEMLATCMHPNVVRLYGYCVAPPRVCLILELLPWTLQQRIHGFGTQGSSSTCGGVPRSPHVSPTKAAPATLETEYHTAVDGSDAGDGTAADGVLLLEDGSAVVQVGVPPPQAAAPQPLTMLDVVRVSADIASGLAFLHSQRVRADWDGEGIQAVREEEEEEEEDWHSAAEQERKVDATRIVHRDLKPANVLINSAGVAKLSDFGLARPHHNETVSSMTVMGAGTSKYMAPELLLARYTYAQAVTNRVDIYSLGIMMWEMLSKELPWTEHTTEASLVMAVVRRNLRPPLPLPPAPAPAALSVHEQQQGQCHPPAVPDLSVLPASLDALLELNVLIDACWQQRDLRRPSAAQVHHRLQELLATQRCT